MTRHPPQDEAATPRTRHPPCNQAPPGTRNPPEQSMLGDTVNERAVRILLECNLVIIIIIDGSLVHLFWLHVAIFLRFWSEKKIRIL